MKKLSIVLLLCVLFLFASCSTETGAGVQKETPSDASGNSDTANNTEPMDTDFAMNETAVFEDLKITATDIKISNGNDYVQPEDGKIFLGVKFSIENISEEDQTVSSVLLFDPYVDDVKASFSFSGAIIDEFSEGTLDGSIASGKKLEGWYVVDAASTAKKIQFDVKSNWLSSTKASFVLEIPQA